jgi:transaldolase/glucose-6-phosphate isomerase
LHVLDSTDPAQVARIERSVDLARTVVVVASKSGSTLEPNVFKQYFFARVQEVVGETAGQRFIAITDPGSKMEAVAARDGFWRVFHGQPSIGGRYSALSLFGMVPAAIMGLDVDTLLQRTDVMVDACRNEDPRDNPGVVLGTILGVAGVRGRDKVTFVTSPRLSDLGAWLEQLIAESTGKNGRALIPVDREALAPPAVYGNDRVFVYVRHASAADAGRDAAVDALESAGHPVVRIDIDDVIDLGQELFRWEIATAVAGAIIGINPFDQPDVEASKVATRKLTSAYEESGKLPDEEPLFTGDGITLFTDAANARALQAAVGAQPTLTSYLEAHFNRAQPGDYVAVLAYVDMNEAHERLLQQLRHVIRDRKRVATCLGFGPRFLHSTGQAYKGGPNTGVFLQVTCDDAADLPIPDQRYTFGVVKAAQARGDFAVLAERGRRVLRVHLPSDVAAGLRRLNAALAIAAA